MVKSLRVKNNRNIYRAMAAGKSIAHDLNSPLNEGFSFTPHEFELLKKARPHLFDPDNATRLKNWKAWSQTSEGKEFRVR